MGPILNLVTGDGKRLVDVMHLRLFRPTLYGVDVGVAVCIELLAVRCDPTDQLPLVSIRYWNTVQHLLNGAGESTTREAKGVKAWYSSRDEACKEHIRMVQAEANEKVLAAMATLGK